MATLLDCCTRALDEISSINVPDFIVGNPDDAAKQLLALAKKIGTELVRDYDWQEMIREATLTTVADTAIYDLESDYDRLVSDTNWDRTSRRRVSGNSTARQWNLLKASPITAAVDHYFRLIGGQLQINPTPAAGIEFAYEYMSKNYCASSGGTKQEVWTADTDVPLLPEDLFIGGLKYYFQKENNIPYGDAEAEYDAVITSRTSKNTPSGAVNMAAGIRLPGRRYTQRRLNIPYRIPT